tara:strand:+ start:5403 stop:5816 length:414 start_codon:yes stop_codon:yes gene_type:complete
MDKKYFTIEEAQKALPKVKETVLKLQQLQEAIDMVNSVYLDPDQMSYDEYMATDTQLSKKFHKFSYEFYKELEKLDRMGILIKDLPLGLVDFYAKFEGRDIFLCWHLGEDKIKCWHELHEGFKFRKPIIDLGEIKIN